jgi:hypothetical protein
LKGLPWALQHWQNFSLRPFLGTQPVRPPDALHFGLPLALDEAVLPFLFALRFTPFFSTILSKFWPQSKHEFLLQKMIFLYYAYVGICSLKDGFDLNKLTQSVATAPATAAWTCPHISVTASNWFDNVYLIPICLDSYKCPRFTKLGLVTCPFNPTTLFVNSSASSASSDLPFGSDACKHLSNHISIFYAPFLNLSTPSLCLCYPISACLPPTIVLIPSHRSVLHTHTSKTGYVLVRTKNYLGGTHHFFKPPIFIPPSH